MKRLTLARTSLVAIGVAAIAGCAPHRTVVYQPQPATTGSATIVVQHPSEPPAIQPETIPQPPETDYFWVRGAWEWHDGRWVWEPGHWEHPNPGHAWTPGHWERTEGGYIWIGGHWR